MSLSNSTEDGKVFSRLPKNVQPLHYAITLKPDLVDFKFTGQENIKIHVNESKNTIVLNSLDIKINSVTFKANNVELKAVEVKTNDVKELLTIYFGENLPVGDGELFIDYIGNLNQLLKGFYRCKTVTHDKKEIYSGVTQFEPTDARRAFPCWDEPAIKSRFDITLIVPKDKTALSNMNVINEEEYQADKNYKVVKFATTPLMSTYLVAAAVGDYDFIEDKSSDGVLCRFYCQKTQADLGKVSLDICVKALPFYKDYFGIAYPLSKMDFLAVPDFSAGAMENWGLITYRESCVFFDKNHTALDRKQLIAIYVAHELAHQWFGNLVTMEWWTDLWLNEGFATFMEFLCVDHIHPEYKIWNQFVTTILYNALDLDALENSHPIEVPVGNPAEIDEIFDDISYCKGASVIRMMYNYIGDKDFKEGLHNYLVKYSYKNAKTDDLWQSFEDSSKKPIRDLMSSWTKQKGYPVIHVTSKQEGTNRVFKLTQEKFCKNGNPCEQDKNLLWMTPISVCKQSNPSEEVASILLKERTGEITVPNVKPGEWVKLNRNLIGFYRINYTEDVLDQFYEAIQKKELPPLDRLNILNDLFAMVQSGRVSSDRVLKLMKAFVNEDDFTVWLSLISCFAKLNSLLKFTDFHQEFKQFGRSLFSNIFEKLGYDTKDGDDHMTQLLRPLILQTLASLDHEEIGKEAMKRFDDHYHEKQLIPADIRGAMYRAVAVNCDDVSFERFIELYRKADLHGEKNKLIVNFGYVRDESKIERLLNFIVSGEVRDQDLMISISSISGNKTGIQMLWKFFQNNFELFKKRCASGFLIGNIIKASTNGFASEDMANEVENFFNVNKIANAERAIHQSIESIRLNAQWLNRDAESIRNFLKNNK